ncbi:hypothetical protein P13BB106kb_p020 [Pectobacterium phage DU_PP_V]|uniref:Uncharacterized protein n=1 Tax=Pectobacterium phage DU_PP_V TaxID=2041492 RepID=A0A2D2W717_9CAUD|nr:hypothetical protein HOS40_gp020 [Pectobacterium phage DU_PP_V]ATS94004.1 hypothetical protein P13BB106kb_p020 [Pectobacterium phage DU_PP_V]
MIFITIVILYLITVAFMVNESGNWNKAQVIKTALFVFPLVGVSIAQGAYWVINVLLKTKFTNTYLELASDAIRREINSGGL